MVGTLASILRMKIMAVAHMTTESTAAGTARAGRCSDPHSPPALQALRHTKGFDLWTRTTAVSYPDDYLITNDLGRDAFAATLGGRLMTETSTHNDSLAEAARRFTAAKRGWSMAAIVEVLTLLAHATATGRGRGIR